MKERIQVNFIGSAWGVLFASWVAVMAGVLVGGWEYVAQPVKIVNSMPGKAQPGQVYLVRGDENATLNWQEKLAVFSASNRASNPAARRPAAVSLTSGDLNVFFKQAVRPAEGQKSPATLYFRLHQGQMQMALTLYPSWLSSPLPLQARGVFKQNASGFYFDAQEGTIGSLPLPGWLAGPLTTAIINKTFASPQAAGWVTAWQDLKIAEVKEDRLELVWK